MTRSHLNNRQAMALRLAEFLATNGNAEASTVALLSEGRRRQIERLAGERHAASDETWQMVVENLRRWESRQAEDALRYVDNEAFIPAGVAA